MARRDNQGIQIAMIVFILTTLLFMVTTYFCYSSMTALQGELESTQSKLNDASGQRDNAVNLVTELKSKVGIDPITDNDVARQQIEEWVTTTYGQGLPAENQSLLGIIENRVSRVAELTQQLSSANKQVQDLRADLATTKETSVKQLADAQARENEAHQQFQKAENDLQEFRRQSGEKQLALSDDRNRMEAELSKTKSDTEKQIASFQKERDDAIRRAEIKQEELNIIKKDTPDRYDGRVIGSVAATGTVLLDVGSADGVRPKTTFGIYDADDSNVRTATKKASVEVTRVLGPHRSEARITDTDYVEPIVRDDFIYSPIWSPGTTLGIALVGEMDIDEDGRDDRDYIRNLIRMNGGRIDAEDIRDRVSGEMSVDTRYIVVGEGELTGAANDMLNEAKLLTIERMSVTELLDLMSPPGRARVVSYGGAPKKGDFAPKAEGGIIQESTGSTSFRKRTPTPRRDRPKNY